MDGSRSGLAVLLLLINLVLHERNNCYIRAEDKHLAQTAEKRAQKTHGGWEIHGGAISHQTTDVDSMTGCSCMQKYKQKSSLHI